MSVTGKSETPAPLFIRWLGRTPMARWEAVSFYLMISPWVIGFFTFIAYPMVRSFYLAFTRYNLKTPPKWVGLDNFVKMFTDDDLFWQSFKVTSLYVLGSVPAGTLFALLVAMILAQQLRGVNFWRTIYFMPTMVSGVAVAVMWTYLLNPQFGLANAMLKVLGLPTIGWLTDPNWSKPSLILINAWAFGGSVVIFLAALQDIPRQLYEAADLDGANAWVRTRYITLPMLTPVIFFNLINGIIGAFQYFTNAYVITGGSGGPAGSTTFYSLLLYRNAFSYFKMGYAAAMAWLLFAAVFVMTLLLFKSSGRWVYYEGGDNN